MKVSKEKAAANRARMISQASRLFREHGLAGVGVDALTRAAGMTHGSLYSQFGSKETLMAEILRQRQMAAPVEIKSATEAGALYLSARHRDNPGGGCFMAALGSEMGRQAAPVRRAFTEIVRANITRLAALLPKKGRRSREDEALGNMATMVGALILARAVDDPALSERILRAGRARLTVK